MYAGAWASSKRRHGLHPRVRYHYAQHRPPQQPGTHFTCRSSTHVQILTQKRVQSANTDAESAVQVKKKMTKEDFIKMNRGINDNKDLPVDFLLEARMPVASGPLHALLA